MKSKHNFMVILSAFYIVVLLCACGQKAKQSQVPTWQEQYDLGIRYLSEGNYEEAIIAFTAAIEIDPKQAPAYVGRGDAYIGSGETEEYLAAAQADYEAAIALDAAVPDAYLGLAEVSILRGDYANALDILRQGLTETGGNSRLSDRIAEIEDLDGPANAEQSDETSYNAYGGTEFTQRGFYREAADLTDTELTWLEAAFHAAADFDEPALRQLLEECVRASDGQWFRFYTIWNGYKVEFSLHFPDPNASHHDSPRLEGEFRPENGVGYSFFVYLPGEPTGMEGASYGYGNRLAACQCVDWQWNGTASIVDVSIRMEADRVDIFQSSTGTVPMVNSLREGDYVQDYTSFTSITTYDKGIKVAWDGEPPRYPSDAAWSICSGLPGPIEEDQYCLDALYW